MAFSKRTLASIASRAYELAERYMTPGYAAPASRIDSALSLGALTILLTLFLSSSAVADAFGHKFRTLEVCNRGSNDRISIAISYYEPGLFFGGWQSSGWYQIPSRDCYRSTKNHSYMSQDLYVTIFHRDKDGNAGIVDVEPGNETLLGRNRVFLTSNRSFCANINDKFSNSGDRARPGAACPNGQQLYPFPLRFDLRETSTATFNVNFDGGARYLVQTEKPSGRSTGARRVICLFITLAC